MRSGGVGVLSPLLDDLRFSQAAEDFSVQLLVTELSIERFAVSVCPRTSGFDGGRFGSDLG